jgi:Ca-activated chloride channel homolog
MSLDWPWMLLTLAVLPFVVRWYRRLLRARAARRAELAALGLVAPAAGGTGRGRHLPAALVLAALALLCVGLARPEAAVPQPRREGTVVLAVDVSGSMAANDVAPSRLAVAKSAAKAFVERQPPTIRIGVVAFGGTGLVTQEVTDDRSSVLAAIDRLSPQGATSLGAGLQAALGAIVGRPVLLDGAGGQAAGGIDPQGPDLGYHGSSAVVLFTDGENTGDPDPVQVADIASSAGVKVYPVGLGTPQGAVLDIDGYRVATALDEAVLRAVATHTDGRYVAGADPQALAGLADAVEPTWTVAVQHIEVTAVLAIAAGLCLLAGVGLSMARTGRVL